ncbi:T9SS type A sorting domain-containing protein [candidate division KSB1 bacterium]|nr:T9SS type A sorting domain-containing protein [candidate division KSB1 bacterium]
MRKIIFKNIHSLLFLIFVFHGKSYSQNWISYSEANGLSSNVISAIVEDDHGLIWVGTFGGLNQFNGRDWISYRRANGDSLISDSIAEIMKDSEGNLWIGTRNGLSKIDPENDLKNPASWHNYNQTNTHGGLVDNDISAILEDNDGNIWIGTRSKGISILKPAPAVNQDPLLDPVNWAIVNSDSQLLSLEIFALEKDKLGNIWVGTFEGVSRYNPKLHAITGKWDLFPELGDTRSIFADSYGYVWFGRPGTGKGPVRVLAADPSQRDEFSFPDDADAIGEDSDGKIWFGTAELGDGIFVVDPTINLEKLIKIENWVQFTQQDGLASNAISHIFRDSEGDMWIGTGENGISRFDISWLNFSKGFDLDFRSVVTIAEDDSNNLWFGTDDRLRIVNLHANLFLKKNWTMNIINKMEKGISNDIRTIYKDDKSQFWIGATPEGFLPPHSPDDPKYGGLLHVNPASDLSNHENWDRFTVHNTNGALADNNVNAIAQDEDRYMWFGTNKGLNRVHIDSTEVDTVSFSTWMKFDTLNGLNSNEIKALFFDDDQNFLWVGTTEGLNRKDLAGDLKTDWERIDFLEGIGIETIFKDLEGFLWIGTAGRGVYKSDLSRSGWTLITTTDAREGLTVNSTINAIVQKRLNEYWFATDAGLIRLRITEMNGQIDSLWTIFGAEDGPGTLGIQSAFLDSKGDIWFGTTGKGVTRHRIKATPPETFITSKLDVTSEDNTIIQFKGADLNTSTRMFRYSYQFDNKGWSPFLPSEVVPIFGLNPGRHLFEVRAADMDGNIDATPARDVFYKINPRLGGKVETSDSTARIRLYFPPGELGKGELGKGDEIAITTVENYEFADSLVIVAFDITLQHHPLQFKKPATLAISFLNTPAYNPNRMAIFRQNENSEWTGIGGTVTTTGDSLTITTAVTALGIQDRYAVRKEKVQQIDTQMEVNIQPRIFSPAGGGQGHGDRATISFTLQNDAMVSVKIYDLAGRLKKVLRDNGSMFAGINAIDWDGRDDDGRICVSGLYVVTIKAEGKVQTKTVMVANRYK